ncbi:MAG TPA: hypothetical protein VFQ61_21495 [Polyangiaceae bacterium]|nr:hypothetical protein [Polyangiaceae bacterium]
MRADRVVRFKTRLCELTIERPAPSLIVLKLSGHDIGELGDAPFEELEGDFASEGPQRELFIDARGGQGASIEVSGSWAQWLRRHKARLRVVHFLTASRFIQLSADFVRKFAELGETMRIYTDPDVFDAELESAVDRELSR